MSNEKYRKIINMPSHRSLSRPPMSMHDRAAQFAPFAALTGYGDAISEAERLTESVPVSGEYENGILDERIGIIREHIGEQPEITIRYFVFDERKSGGEMKKFTGRLRVLDEADRKMYFSDGTAFFLDDIYGIEGTLFESEEETP